MKRGRQGQLRRAGRVISEQRLRNLELVAAQLQRMSRKERRRRQRRTFGLAAALAAVAAVVLQRLRARTRGGSVSWDAESAESEMFVSEPSPPPPTSPVTPQTTTLADAGAAVTAPVTQAPLDEDEVRPEDLTSPGTVRDPTLEEQRAEEAAERERESRASDVTKFEELREEEEAERAEQTARIGEPLPPVDES